MEVDSLAVEIGLARVNIRDSRIVCWSERIVNIHVRQNVTLCSSLSDRRAKRFSREQCQPT